MSGDRLSNDLLLQIAEKQSEQGETLARIEGNLTARVEALEAGARWNKWMTYVVTPFLMMSAAVARHFGVKV